MFLSSATPKGVSHVQLYNTQAAKLPASLKALSISVQSFILTFQLPPVIGQKCRCLLHDPTSILTAEEYIPEYKIQFFPLLVIFKTLAYISLWFLLCLCICFDIKTMFLLKL